MFLFVISSPNAFGREISHGAYGRRLPRHGVEIPRLRPDCDRDSVRDDIVKVMILLYNKRHYYAS